MASFCRSNRNGKIRILHGWGHHRYSVRPNYSYWRCIRRVTNGCVGMLRTLDRDGVLQPRMLVQHTCLPNPAYFEARNAYNDMKDKVETTTDCISDVMASVENKISRAASLQLPSPPSAKRLLRLHKRATIGSIPEPRFVSHLVLPARHFDLERGLGSMLVHDTGGGPIPSRNRVIVLATPHTLRLLARSDVWLSDGTFKLFPLRYWTQMYTIHVAVGNETVLCAVALLNNKTTESYVHVLRRLIDANPAIAATPPDTIITDFEAAAILAYRQVFPGIHHAGCFFHLRQAVHRKIASLGLESIYRRDRHFRLCCRMMTAAAFAPPADVRRAWRDWLADGWVVHFRRTTAGFEQLVTYFESTYVCRPGGLPGLFPIRLWNVYRRCTSDLPRTTNNLEGWHSGFVHRMRRNPSVQAFLAVMKTELLHSTKKDDRAVHGIPLRYTDQATTARNDAIVTRIAAYDRTLPSLVPFLESICEVI